jgi:hypothetical protein
MRRDLMVKKRRRFKQTTTLAERLTAQAGRLRNQARSLPPGSEQTELWHKVRQAETALRVNQWLLSSEAPPPADLVSLVGKNSKKRLSSKVPGEST